MNDQKSRVEDFFNLYAVRFNRALSEDNMDVNGIVSSFADDFIEASPLGIHPGKNNNLFKEAIPKGILFYKAIGIHQMNIDAIDVTLLDNFHALAKVQWVSLFVTSEKRTGAIEFTVIYLLQSREDSIKIFAFITGDEREVLRKNGLIP